MATNSPGIYYSEKDNTGYTNNPTSTIGTTVAIVSFARKGPIGVPTEIKSYSDFKATFGTPIGETFAGIAVKNVLSSGGVVLFTRVADESIASKSNVVLKNGSEATDGKIIFTNEEDITIDHAGYELSSVYSGVLSTSKGVNKNLIIRSPSQGKLKLSSIVDQIKDSLLLADSYTEYKAVDSIDSTDVKLFSIYDEDFNAKTFYVNANEGSVENFVENLETSVENSAAYHELYIYGTNANEVTVVDPENKINHELTKAGITSSESELKFVITFKYTDSDSNVTSTNKKVTISLTQNGSDYFVSYKDIANQLNEQLSDVYVKYCVRKEQTLLTTKDENTPLFRPSFVFILSNKSYKAIEVTSFASTTDSSSEGADAISTQSMFLPYFNAEDTMCGNSVEPQGVTYYNGADENPYATYNGILVCFGVPVESESFDTSSMTFEINSDTNSLIITDDEAKYTFNNSAFTSFLFNDTKITEFDQSSSIAESSDFAVLKEMNENCILTKLAEVTESEALNFSVDIIDGKITLYQKGVIDSGTVSLISAIDGYKDLSEIIEGVEEVDGSAAVSSSNKDIIVFTAREYGSGTTDIGIDINTTVSPVDDVTTTHDIDLYVNGVKVESWENVSYNPSDSNYFVTLINSNAENGGSNYIKATVIKNDTTSSEVGLKDTSDYTENSLIYIGQALNENSVERTSKIKESNYEKYDYFVGNNGIPNNTNDIFVDALKTGGSGLSNKDLYAWHILITPDNISEEVQDAATSLVEYMEDAVYIVDPPEELTKDQVIKWHNGKLIRGSALQSDYTITYWPWVQIYDSTTAKYVWAPPSVVMAPRYCQVDKEYAPWYAPAGETNGLMSTVIDIADYPVKSDRDELYVNNRINPFIKLKNGNILCFGEKTCKRKNSTLTKVHTRRMLVALKHDLRNALTKYIFMPTMEENIAEIKTLVDSIISPYKIGGGVSDYNVICDLGINNTTETLQQDIVNVDIAVVPTGCIEEVHINFSLEKELTTES